MENDGLSKDSSSHIFEANNNRVTKILMLIEEVPFIIEGIKLYACFSSEHI